MKDLPIRVTPRESSVTRMAVPPREDDSSKLLQILWNRKGLVLLGMVAGLVIAFLYQLRLAPVFQVSAQVMVVRKKVDPGIDVRTAAVDDYVATQLAVIKGDQVLREAAVLLQEEAPSQPADTASDDPRAPGARQSLAGMDPSRVVEFLKSGIEVAKDTQSASPNIVRVSFRSESPRDCSLALRSIIRGYKAFLDKMYNMANDAYMTRLDRAISTARRDAASLRDDLRNLESKVQESATSGALNRQASLNEASRAQQVALERLRARREDIVDQARVSGLMTRADLTVGEDPLSSGINLSLLQEIRLLERKVRSLNRQGLGKDHPDVRDLLDEIRDLKSADAPGVARDDAKRAGRAGPETSFASRSEALLSHLDDKINELEGKLEESKSSLSEIQPQVDEIRQVESRKTELVRKLEKADRDVELHEQIRQQYLMTKDHGGYDAQEITRIPEMGSPVPSRGSLILLVGLFFGGAAGSGLAWLAEKTDRSFRDPSEVSRTLGMPILGHIPQLDLPDAPPDDKAALDASLVAHHSPKSQEAEAYRGLRTAIYSSIQRGGLQVIQVTSPSAGDGKSTLSANLAISMAQSGRKVLLIDADMRKPRVHKLIRGEHAGAGLSAFIQGSSSFADSWRATGIINLSVMCCGTRPPNPAELLTSPRFIEAIDEARKAFDIVIIDTPPLLAVSDPCIIAARVDGVVLTMRLRKEGRPLAERAGEILGGLDARILGVVVNGCDPSGSHGYKGYYGYKYNYYYSYSDYHHYNDDEGRSSPAPSTRVLPSLGLRPRKPSGS